MQMKEVIALVIMALLLLVLVPMAIILNPEPPSFKHLAGRVDPLPAALQGSVGVYYHYYGWPDGLSVLVIDHVSGKQLKPGEASHVWGSSATTSLGGSSGGSLRFRDRVVREDNTTISVGVRSSGDRRDVKISLEHRFESSDSIFAQMVVEGIDYELTSDTVFFIDHQLDGTHEVKQIDFDLTELVGESEDRSPRMRGVPTTGGIEAFLVQNSVIQELLVPGYQQQK